MVVKSHSAFSGRKFNDLPQRVMDNCLTNKNLDSAINHLVKKKYGSKYEIINAVNKGAGQEIVETAYDEYGWRP